MNIKQVLKAMLRRWWIFLILISIAGGLTFYLNNFVLEPIYMATTSIFVNDKEQNSTEFGIAYDQILVNTQLIADYTELMKSRTIAKAVINDLHLEGYKIDEIIKMISVSSKNNTRIIEISATGTDQIQVMEVANSVAKVFSQKAVELMNVLNVNIVDPAEIPENPVGPNKVRNAILAVFAAFACAAGIIFLIEYLDNTIKNAEDVENRLGLTVLGTIPDLKIK